MKVDSHQVPKEYFEYLLGKAKLKVNAVKDTSHKSQPSYNSSTRKISYKIFDPDSFFDALEESHVAFTTEAMYSGNERHEDSSSVLGLSAPVKKVSVTRIFVDKDTA